MLLRNTIISLLLFLQPVIVSAQAIDNTLSYKNINTNDYFRLSYENDFFASTDKYYTQGVNPELLSPWVKKFPLSKLLFHPCYSSVRYGLGVEHDGYTPSDIAPSRILYGDRPFAACI